MNNLEAYYTEAASRCITLTEVAVDDVNIIMRSLKSLEDLSKTARINVSEIVNVIPKGDINLISLPATLLNRELANLDAELKDLTRSIRNIISETLLSMNADLTNLTAQYVGALDSRSERAHASYQLTAKRCSNLLHSLGEELMSEGRHSMRR
ncbi:hypothetical protein [Pseudomonas marginalis]|uniref:hypothetical protein n=1 Tax=Pseudomonas marginalis TaxID=298 RepID=UPI0011C3CCEE|nr:hypothetical protein [Pseudomonas marginalis]